MSPATAALATEGEVIDYDALYADYSASLVDMLRGFSPKVKGLELWVPDENLGVSLRNLLDSAANLGRSAICLRLGEKSGALLEPQELLELGRAFGRPSVERRAEGLLFEVSGLVAPTAGGHAADKTRPATPQRTQEADSVATAAAVRSEPVSFAGYERRLRQLASVTEPGKAELTTADTLGVTFALAGSELGLEVRASDQTVVGARGRSSDEVQALLLAELSRLIVGLPLLEACYHGALRLEHRLRPVPESRPVAGIALPSAVHPRFALIHALLLGALTAYRDRSGYAVVRGQYDQRPRAEWLSLDFEGRRLRILGVLAELAPRLGISESDVTVVSIRYDVRVELGLSEAWRRLDQPRLIMALERELQARVEPRLEVYVQELKDKNQLRRLALVETPQ